MNKKTLIDLPAEQQYAAIEEIIVRYLSARYRIQKKEISRFSSFRHDFGLNSLDFCELLVHIEEKTDIYVPDEDINFDEDTVDVLIKAFIKNI